MGETLNQIIWWQLLSCSRGKLEILEILYFLKYILEISCRNKDIPKYQKVVLLKTSKLRNDFSELFEKNSSKKWFPIQLNSMANIFGTAVIQKSLALNFNWNFLMPEFHWSTRILSWLISFHIFHSCTILVYSIGHTGFLLHLARFQHCNLCKFGWRTQVQTGSQGFCFPCCSILQRNFPNLAWKFLLCVPQKVFGVYIFPNFVLL